MRAGDTLTGGGDVEHGSGPGTCFVSRLRRSSRCDKGGSREPQAGTAGGNCPVLPITPRGEVESVGLAGGSGGYRDSP
jgi:hypothetical protein